MTTTDLNLSALRYWNAWIADRPRREGDGPVRFADVEVDGGVRLAEIDGTDDAAVTMAGHLNLNFLRVAIARLGPPVFQELFEAIIAAGCDLSHPQRR